MAIPPPFPEQSFTAKFWNDKGSFNNFSDPGTGKTRCSIDGFKDCANAKRMLVIAPLSILRASWGADIDTFAPEINWRVAHGSPQKRKDAFLDFTADVVIMNHDGVKWLKENEHLLDGFTHLAVDESTAFKTQKTQRTKAIHALIKHFEYRTVMTGTPHPKNICDIWAQVFITDKGERLGNNFHKFQYQVCTSKEETITDNTGKLRKYKKWAPIPGAEEDISALIADITVRFKLKDVPHNDTLTYKIDMPKWLRDSYDEFIETQVFELENNEHIAALHSSAVYAKARQILSGAVYCDGQATRVHTERTELCLELAKQAEHSVIGFNYRHERETLCSLAHKMKLDVTYIDGTVPEKKRNDIVQDYQAGKYDIIFLHPQAAGHGLTFTRGTRTIWHSATHDLEHYIQLNRRIYRRGQENETQTIRVMYNDSLEEHIYENTLNPKAESQNRSLDIFELITRSQT